MSNDSFFDEPKEQSLVKARIVEKYFWVWAKVIIPTAKQAGNKIAYIDLFAGPGRYKDGSKSTPIKVLETAISDPDMRNMLITVFNDADPEHTNSLQESIDTISGVENLKYKPFISNYEVGEKIVGTFEKLNLVPTLFFVDPWGYKGLSLKLINSVVKNWGCDCLFFFNYNRINMGLTNPAVEKHINALFEETRADRLREQLKGLNPEERELTIVEAICKSLQEMGGKYVLPFRFKHENGNRTSHHLIFVSKHFKGYEIMKKIMAQESSEQNQGVPSFEYNPATIRQPLLFEISRPLDDLEQMLMDELAGKTITMQEIYMQHNVGRSFIDKNYKDALKNLESQGKITAEPPVNERRKNTFGDPVKVTFPPKQ
ncbi:three-Cys-motif partner protein TcmP [Dolichospermum circinale CS-537/01]|uniref:Three-Cys-motif partner protein TcmP n=1 Tax=Dolichospermum circinale CS-537/01 TaxID=3021739 RepID=A0ABT5A554_9CYAN|nr:three-Cys-motif partner protein TcmP [Dolichospermum circinale]MDB9487072.1 three-Cys-motif partner protein TcmP [Dolichospermum circinale CS-537/01]